MSRKRVLIIVLPVIAALAIAGGAIAAKKPTPQPSVTSASSIITASTASHVHNVKCTAKSGDAFQSTVATYKGTATSQDARLNGPITIQAHSFFDTTSSLGTVTGTFTIVGSKKNSVTGTLTGVVTADGTFSGIATGKAKGPVGKLLASLGGSFTQSGGFATATLGGPETGGGVVVANGACPVKKK
jgi:hypothetical protein